MKHSRSNIAKATQELFKAMDSVNQTLFLKVHQVIKYILDIRILALKLEPKRSKEEHWNIVCFSDSDTLEIQS